MGVKEFFRPDKFKIGIATAVFIIAFLVIRIFPFGCAPGSKPFECLILMITLIIIYWSSIYIFICLIVYAYRKLKKHKK